VISGFQASYSLKSTSFFFFSFSGWGETESTWYVGHCRPIVPAPDDRWWLWSSRWNEDWQGKPKYSEKTCPSATLSNTNPTWPDLGSNPGRRGGKPATNRLSYGTALKSTTFWYIMQCSPLKVNRRFGGTYRLHLQDWRISRARNQRESRRQAELWRTTAVRTSNPT
jgi:hypothetical protein